jgi:hypothetical protein
MLKYRNTEIRKYRNVLIENALEGYGSYGLLDLNLESLQKAVRKLKEEYIRRSQ